MNKYIDLYLEKEGDQTRQYVFEETLNNNDIIVLLGSPGSGKTTILRNYEKNNVNHAEFKEVNDFLELDEAIEEQKEVLLLDAMDEYRSVSSNKCFVPKQLGKKIKNLKAKVVISCREMDWFGEDDEEGLMGQINKEKKAGVFYILPPNEIQRRSLAQIYGVKEESVEIFIKRFNEYGFLENPQMIKMMAELYSENQDLVFKNKRDLYEQFIKNAGEKNKKRLRNQNYIINGNDLLKTVGYIASFFILSDVKSLNEEFVRQVYEEAEGLPSEKIKQALNTQIVKSGKFSHRTIAEFAAAFYINNKFSMEQAGIAAFKVKNFFMNTSTKKIPTRLRGVYAWLCSLTENQDLIEVDPYYQTINGDNSHFSSEQIKNLFNAVEKYSKENNNFFHFRKSPELGVLYRSDLDEYFMENIEKSLDTQFIYFLIYVAVSARKPSEKILEFFKSLIINNKKSDTTKRHIMPVFENDVDFLEEILREIVSENIIDEDDDIKEYILTILYPKKITPKNIVKYLEKYHDDTDYVGRCVYLQFHTNYDEKECLVRQVHEAFSKRRGKYHKFPEHVNSFVEDFFLETILLYNERFNAKEIYEILKSFRKHYEEHEQISFESYRYEIKDKEENKNEDMKELSEELYSLFIDDVIDNFQGNRMFFGTRYYFGKIFSYKNYFPENPTEILLKKMNNQNNQEKNQMLFEVALNFLDIDDRKSDKFENIAKKFKLLSSWEKLTAPREKNERVIESEKRKEAEVVAKQFIIDQNEKEFKKTDDEILNSFGHLEWIANHLYISEGRGNNEISSETMERLKRVLRKLIYSPFEPKLATVEELAKTSPSARRHIDNVYFVSAQLQDESFHINSIDKELLKYLYIVVLSKRSVVNLIRGPFIKIIQEDTSQLDIQAMQEFLSKLLQYNLPELKDLIEKYCLNESVSKDLLKGMCVYSETEPDDIKSQIVNNFIDIFNLLINSEDLERISKVCDKKENKLLEALICFNNKNCWEEADLSTAINLYSPMYLRNEGIFSILPEDKKVELLYFMMSKFNTPESIKFVGGMQSLRDEAASFLRERALSREFLSVEGLKNLKNRILTGEIEKMGIWIDRINNALSTQEQENADKDYCPHDIESIKNFLLSDAIFSGADFFEDVFIKLQDLKDEIQNHRKRDKNDFYEGKDSKNENLCRDVVYRRLCDKYKSLDIKDETSEGENRVDLNIKYKANLEFEVQVECKKDNNSSLFSGLKEQLIDKYMCDSASTGTNKYGIYLVFYFEEQKMSAEKIQEKLEKEIPEKYKNNIKVIIFDLRKPAKTTRKSSGKKPNCMSQNKSKHTILSKRKKDAGNN